MNEKKKEQMNESNERIIINHENQHQLLTVRTVALGDGVLHIDAWVFTLKQQLEK